MGKMNPFKKSRNYLHPPKEMREKGIRGGLSTSQRPAKGEMLSETFDWDYALELFRKTLKEVYG